MANVAEGGFRFKRMKVGMKTPDPIQGWVTTNNSTGIFWGDAVKRTSAGDWVVAAAGDAIGGICLGAERYLGTDGVMRKGGNFLPASTTYTGGLLADQSSVIRIIPAFGALFEVDTLSNTLTTLAAYQAIVGENVNLNAATAGNTTTGRSGMVVDESGHVTTNTLTFRVEEISARFDADPTAANFKLIVSVNLCQDVPYVILGT